MLDADQTAGGPRTGGRSAIALVVTKESGSAARRSGGPHAGGNKAAGLPRSAKAAVSPAQTGHFDAGL